MIPTASTALARSRVVSIVVVTALVTAGFAALLTQAHDEERVTDEDTLTSSLYATGAAWGAGREEAYTVGGFDSGDAPQSLFITYDPHNGAEESDWSGDTDPTAPAARAETSAVWNGEDDVVYAFGGRVDDPANPDDTLAQTLIVSNLGGSESFETYDWSESDDAPDARAGTSAVWDNESKKAYIFGGWTGEFSDGYKDQVLVYDPNADAANRIAEADSDDHKLRAYTAAAWDPDTRTAYVIGGENGQNDALDDIVKFDAESETRTDMDITLPEPRTRMSAVWSPSEDVVYAFGGEDADGNPSKATYRIDPVGSTVEAVAWHDMTTALSGTSAVYNTSDARAYIFGGNDGGAVDTIQHYNPESIEHDPDIVPQQSVKQDDIAIEPVLGSGFTVSLEVENSHSSCSPGEVGCTISTPFNVSVYGLNDTELEDELGSSKLSQISADNVEDLLAGKEPLEKTLVDNPNFEPGDRTLDVTGVPLNEFKRGQVVTVVGVVDGCEARYPSDDPDGFDPSAECELSEGGADSNQQNVYIDQWTVGGSNLPLSISSTLVDPAQESQLHENATDGAEVTMNVTVSNTVDRSLDRRFGLEVRVDGEEVPESPFEFDGLSAAGSNGSTHQEQFSFEPNTAGNRTVNFEVTYPDPGAQADQPENHPAQDGNPPANVSKNQTLYFQATDFALDQSTPSPDFPGQSDIPIDATITNVGDFRAADNGHGDLEVGWKRCNRLIQAGDDVDQPFVCAGDKENFENINGSNEMAMRVFSAADDELDPLTPGGSVSTSFTWVKAEQEVGLWNVTGDVDGALFTQDLVKAWGSGSEHSEDNNLAHNEVQLTNVSWSGETFQKKNFSLPHTRFNHTVTVTNDADSDKKFRIVRADRACEPTAEQSDECADDVIGADKGWIFRLWDDSGHLLANSSNGFEEWDVKEAQQAPEVNISAGGQEQLNFEIETPEDGAEPGDFTNVSLVVCEDEAYDEDTAACTGHGDIVDINTSFDAKWDASIEVFGKANVSVAPGGRATFHFWATNEAENVHDAFQLTADIEPSGQGIEPTIKRTKPLGDGKDLQETRDRDCPEPNDDDPACYNPDWEDDEADGDLVRIQEIDLEPGENNQFRVDVDVPTSVSEGTNVTVTVEVESLNSTNSKSLVKRGANGTFESPLRLTSQEFTVSVGQDIGPPTIQPQPPSGTVVSPGDAPTGTPIAFQIRDDGELTSVTRSINGGSFQEFDQTDPYTVPTKGRPDGELTIRVRAQDDDGKVTDRAFTYQIDGTAPTFQELRTFPSTVAGGGQVDLVVSVQEPNLAGVTAKLGNQTVNLNESGSGLYEATVAAPSDPGLYTVNVTAVDQATPTPNQQSTSAEIEVVQPDIQVGDQVTVEPDAPEVDEPTTIRASLTNPSGAELADYPVTLLVDDELVAETNLTLFPNKKTEVSLEWQAGTVGTHDATIQADPNATFDDPDTSNNEVAFTIEVARGGFLGLPGPEIYIIAAAVVFSALLRRRWDARDPRDPHQRDP